MAGLLNFAPDDQLALQGFLSQINQGAPPPPPPPAPDEEDDADTPDEAASNADEPPEPTPEQAPAAPPPVGLLAPPEAPAKPRGILSKIFGTDSGGTSFGERLLGASMGLGGEQGAEGQYFGQLQQRQVQRQTLARQIGGQRLISEAAQDAWDQGKDGEAVFSAPKFWTNAMKLSKASGIPIDPAASATAIKSFRDAGQWKYTMSRDGTVTATNLIDPSKSYIVHGPTAPVTKGPTDQIIFPDSGVPGGPAAGQPGPAGAGQTPGAPGTAPGPTAAAATAVAAQPQVAPGAGGGPGGPSDWASSLGTPVAKDNQRPPTDATAAQTYKLASMIQGEAGGEPTAGKVAVGQVALNRLVNGYGGASNLDQVLDAPNQFTAMRNPAKPSAESLQIAHDLVAGRYADPTGGAVNYLNPELTAKQRGGTVPAWAQGWETKGQRIGQHVFLNGTPQRAGGAAPAAQAQAPVQVKSPEEAKALPPGTQFLTPDGRHMVTPGAPQGQQQAAGGQPVQYVPGVGRIVGQGLPHPPGTEGTAAEKIAHNLLPGAPAQWDEHGMLKLTGGTGYNQATSFKAYAAEAYQKSTNNDALGKINDALSTLMGHEVNLGPMHLNTAGGMAQLLGNVPGTPALDFAAKINGIKAYLSQVTIEQMRNMSPKGGAFGNIAVKEYTGAADAIQNLRAAKDPKATAKDLVAVYQHIQRWQKNLEAAVAAGPTAFANPQAGAMGDFSGGGGGGPDQQ